MNIDTKKYDDVLKVMNCDLFIDKYGYYYKVKKNKSNELINHNTWADYYLKEVLKIDKKINNSAIFLVNCVGMIYYSHDILECKPIIKIPNPNYYKKRATSTQLDALFDIMLINNENPYIVPMLMGEENVYDYIEIDSKNKRKVKRNEENIY